MSERRTVTVRGDRPYDVVIGHHLLGELPGVLGTNVRRVLVVHPAALATTADTIIEDLRAAGYETFGAQVPDAEEAKTAQVAAFCWGVLGQADFTRSDAIVAVGGGATTDLGGFVAATWLRGIQVVHVPTTVLAMVDAAVGGKTGINTAEGKNLVGAFHPPAGVLCDLASLASMAPFDFVAGLAEIVKAGFIADPRILELVEANVDLLKDPVAASSSDVLLELVERAIAVKARVVGRTCARPGCGRSSTTGTRSATPWSTSSGTSGGTAPRCPWAWCSSPSWPGWRARCPTRSSTGTARSSRPWVCRRRTAATAGSGC